MITKDTNVSNLPYVGPAYVAKLQKIGIVTIEDLVWHIPFRYENYQNKSKIFQLNIGDSVSFEAQVLDIKNIYTKYGKKITQAVLADETGTIEAIWFNQMYLVKAIRTGQKYSFSGKVDFFGRKKSLMSPAFEPSYLKIHTSGFVPIYPETEGLSSKWLRSKIAYILKNHLDLFQDIFSPDFIKQYNLIDLTSALNFVHFPNSLEEAELARKRLSFDEFFRLQLSSARRKKIWQSETVGHQFQISNFKFQISNFLKNLPFELTNSQNNAISEIKMDLTKKYPMNRILIGDVGSGKTVVAAAALYISYLNGFQSALMAPTEILTNQHFKTISDLLTPLGVKVKLITSSLKSDVRLQTSDILVGTHSLIQDKIEFSRLGLIVIDEQHRFGVEQREALRKKGVNPHLLTMTATPIPRTIALTSFGELDISYLAEMPKGRLKIKTWVIPETKRQACYEWIKKNAHQTFVVCPLIEESESLASVKAATKVFEEIKTAFPEFKIGLLHGRQNSKKKEEVLQKFRENKIQILIATPVVEVGIDIPEADVMIIETAERFGLAQLHQLRGRIGRAGQQAYCYLFTESDEESSLKRLKSLETIYSGPNLAEIDLDIRGPGNVSGTAQHGFINFKTARFSDKDMIEKAHIAALRLVDDYKIETPEQNTTLKD